MGGAGGDVELLMKPSSADTPPHTAIPTFQPHQCTQETERVELEGGGGQRERNNLWETKILADTNIEFGILSQAPRFLINWES